ncbi:hypothetical protein FACS189454_04700 [Planctomycetales bacterium]|nr:hypothetical protein FACS189454_04700 [Planctomycetales bacterium]
MARLILLKAETCFIIDPAKTRRRDSIRASIGYPYRPGASSSAALYLSKLKQLQKAIQSTKAIKVRKGTDLTIIATGSMLKKAVETADLLEQQGKSVAVLSMHTIKPLDEYAILEAAKTTPFIVTLEEHSILGGAVAEILLEKSDTKIHFKRFGLPSEFTKFVGSQEYLLRQYRLTPELITDDILCWIRGIN